jgi:pimeloyl-ACP methyl ester carboxylesterase
MASHIPGPLYYQQQGRTGTPMIFLHSTPDDHRLWMYQTAHFSAWYRTVAVDLAGYGRSPAVQTGVTVDDQAQGCWEVMDQITDGPIIIQGNSMGAHIAMHMAHQQPKRSLALILSGCGYIPGPRRINMTRWMERYKEKGIALRRDQCIDHFAVPLQKEPVLNYYADMVVELNNHGTLQSIISMNDALADAEPDSFFEQLPKPIMIITASLDRTLKEAHALHEHIPGSELVCMEGAGHACNLEMPWLFDELCIKFLKKHNLWPGS